MTHLLDDYVIAASAGVIMASVVILVVLLSRYKRLVEEADKSTQLAKDVWDSVNSRFTVVDARIIDLMVRSEVASSRAGQTHVVPQKAAVSTASASIPSRASTLTEPQSLTTVSRTRFSEGTETEEKVLRILALGPKTSAQIKQEVGRSREHTSRVMKQLFDRGLVIRNDRNKPYVYEITDNGRSYVAS